MASPLGNTEITPTASLQVSAERNAITLSARSELQALSEKYDGTDDLSPFEKARVRTLRYIEELRNNSLTNLLIGIGMATIGFIILFSAVLQIEQFADKEKHIFDANGFIVFALLPKLSVTLFVQIFSYFFLAMYRSNHNDIKYYQNEITGIDLFAAAVILAQRPGSAPNMKLVLTALLKNERNRVMKKGEKPITTSDDADFLRALSLAARLANRADKD